MTEHDRPKLDAPDLYMEGWERLYKTHLENLENASPEDNMPMYPVQTLLRITARYLKGNGKVLDIACGDGKSTCAFAKLGFQVVAFDALPLSVELTEKRAKMLGVADLVKTQLGEMNSWKIPENEYDVIVATQCLQYLYEKAIPKLRELMRALKPEGFLAFCGNVEPHFPTDPPMFFIDQEALRKELEGWTIFTMGHEEIRRSAEDIRGYVWTVAQKPEDE